MERQPAVFPVTAFQTRKKTKTAAPPGKDNAAYNYVRKERNEKWRAEIIKPKQVKPKQASFFRGCQSVPLSMVPSYKSQCCLNCTQKTRKTKCPIHWEIWYTCFVFKQIMSTLSCA